MGIYLKMSLAYLKKNKLRTLLLTLGVILIFGTSVIKESQNKNDVEAISKLYGGYHLEFNDLNYYGTEKLKNDKDASKITTVQNLGNIVDKREILEVMNIYDKLNFILDLTVKKKYKD